MEETKKTVNKKVVIGVSALVAAIAILAIIFVIFRPGTQEGSKAITIQVVNSAKEVTTYDVKTDAEFLRQAMEETEGLTFSGTESEYGMMVDTVNGETADYSVDGAFWGFYVDGEFANYGIDSQPVYDGNVFSIEYTVDEAEY